MHEDMFNTNQGTFPDQVSVTSRRPSGTTGPQLG
jgi:hypothetical protein